MSNMMNGGHGKTSPKWLRVGSEVGVWAGILMLIATAALSGFGSIAELSGDTALLERYEFFASIGFPLSVAIVAVSTPIFLMTSPRESMPDADQN